LAEAFDVRLAGGGYARAAQVRTEGELDEALAALALPPGPVVLLYGGAGKVEARHRERIGRFFASSLLPAVAGLRGIVIDGGTDAGVMRLVGDAREKIADPIRIVGVAPIDKVRVPGSAGTTELAAGHTDFVLVPGAEWGTESRWLPRIASQLSSGPVATVLVNGGPIALQELEESLDHEGRILVVDGTGRAADDVAAAIRGRASRGSRLTAIADRGSIIVVDATIGPAALASALFTSPEGEGGR
jgi:SLOG in TRPM, prokaryote